MSLLQLRELAWPDVRDLDPARTVVLLPVGAVEAHGPHLPLATDVIIAEAMVRSAADVLAAEGVTAVAAPPIEYTAAPFAAGFPGTISMRPETVTAVVEDIGRSLAAAGLRHLALANAHFDPTHVGSLYAARRALDESGLIRCVFPDVTRKPWALRLTEEFKSGACHAGQYEGSIVLAERPELVREEIRARLVPVRVSLAEAIRRGESTFEGIGGTEAYFGDPAAATVEEGRETVTLLGAILAEAVLASLRSA